MGYINPLFNDQPIKRDKPNEPAKKTKVSKARATRIDKKHNIKFPVSAINQMKLKSYCKQVGRIYRSQGKEPLSQTKFNTLLLRFGLKYEDLIQWEGQYTDTKVYMHTNLLEHEYSDIGGPFGFAIEKNLSERKVVYFIIHSVLNWLEGEGSLDKIL
ncbi:hypothetical protein AWM68_17660 [Fictibacillus phosphorivorans]|uniref:Uncharacterized protein n=1 Tax=Fictibacillus phosphorivorans TaxID=1221500 RepID=A0A163S2C3_9BACL|nr:hypothetical protein [Fictibacillus phosphorivorans]KZE67998.1 hypothetical protein AWM68_17660 [Fictibacillus phosphorivorans]